MPYVLLTALMAVISGSSAPRTIQRIESELNDFHDAAARADEVRYFGHFTQEAVFLGTDAGERWTRAQFQTYAHARFRTGQGWTYTPEKRHVTLAADGKTAWFDEVVRSVKCGPCRGSGVLVHEGGRWKIAQYNLTVPIPNDLLPRVVELIKTAK